MAVNRKIIISAIISIVCLAKWSAYIAPNFTKNIDAKNTAAYTSSDVPKTIPSTTVDNQPSIITIDNMQIADTLQDVQVDGDIIVTATGNVFINSALRNLFDYINTAFESYDDSKRRAWLMLFMQKRQVPANKTAYILDFYLRYTQYKNHSITLISAQKYADTDKLLTKVQSLKNQMYSLQKQYFNTTEIIGFFGAEQEYDNYQIESAIILRDPSLSNAERASALAERRNQLSDETKANILQTTVIEELGALTEQAKMSGAYAFQLHKIRTELVGAAAADRLAQMDEEDAAWIKRINRYKTQKLDIQGNSDLSDEQKKYRLDALVNNSFDSYEQLRLKAYE